MGRSRRELSEDPAHTPGRTTIDELPLLYPGDQTFIRREVYGAPWDWIPALAIRIGSTTGTDREPTVINHVATVIRAIRELEAQLIDEGRLELLTRPPKLIERDGRIVDYLIAEALPSGFKYTRLLEGYGDDRRYSFAVARHKEATRERRDKIVAACDHLLGKSYGFGKVGAAALDYAATIAWNMAGGRGDVYAFRRLCRMERYPMCSWASLYEYEKAGIPFDVSVERGSPDDLWDECRRKALAVWVWPFWSPSLKSGLLGRGFGDEHFGRRRRRE